MKTWKASAVFAALIAFAMGAGAQPYQPKGEAQGWNVFYNEATGGCFAERQTPDMIIMQMGTQADMLGVDGTNYGFLAVYVPVPTDIQAGERRPVSFEIAGTRYGGEAVGVARSGYYGGYAIANNPNFIDNVAMQKEMIINPGTDREATVSLQGTKAALDAVRACQTEMSG